MLTIFEGVDGVGKTTQISLLSSIYPDAIITKEPGGTNLGKKIREILLNSDENLSQKAEMFLFLADRAEHYEKIISRNKNRMIFSDRSFISGIAYAKANDENLDIDKLMNLNKFALNGDFGDKFIFLKANFDILQNRLKSRKIDNIEQRGIEHLKKIEKYMEIIFEKYDFNILKIDSTLEISEIHNKILEFIND